jgi:hypothetical protein
MPPLDRFREAVEEYSQQGEHLERLVDDLRAATGPENATEAERLKGEIEVLLADMDKRKREIDELRVQLEEARDREAELIA